MSSTQKNFALPLAFIGIMFFAIGFALGINSVLIPVLQGSLGITSAESYLIIAATFVPFLIFGYPASMTIKAIGYKHTMALSFAMFAVAFGLYIPSASQESFPLFLVASFVSGTANAFLQASVNPYITILGPLDSAAKRISIMGICNKLAWPIPPLFLAFLIGKEVSDITVSDLFTPFYVIIAAFIILGIISLMAPLPEVKAAGEDDSEGGAEACPYAASKTSVWQFPHLLLGCLALFLYVGVETIAFIALGCSLMWPALWPLAMADLGKFTKAGSSLLIMAMAGGAVIPTLFGYIKDIAGAQNAYWICLPCFLFILYYGMAGYKIRTK